MANELILNKILIIKGILAEKCGLHPDLYEELSNLLDDIRILSDAKDGALAELSHESSGLNKPDVSGEYCDCEHPTLGKSVTRCGNCDRCFKPI